MIKGVSVLILVFSLVAIIIYSISADRNVDSANKVVILQSAEHHALDQTRLGIESHLQKCCKDLAIDYRNGQGNATMNFQIAKQVALDKPRIVVTIGTMASQVFIKEKSTPVVFSSVTDPIKAGLAKSWELPGMNFTGVSNVVDIDPQLETIRKILPAVKAIGFIYNAAEINSSAILDTLQEAAKRHNIEIVESVMSSSNDVINATRFLIDQKVDAIFISNDNTALASMPSITKVANSKKIPVFSSDVDTIREGVLAAQGPSQFEIGVQTGKIIERILHRIDAPGSMPIESPQKIELKVNLLVAQMLGLRIPAVLIDKATEVIR